ncbi:uncharacterized protein LOC123544933 [Mercenaria mercenaria]|uniref:uncharacterized protein LOC123544933 n=1 Tax=Mercenaria mercenaria TaxID=6596 RepID=UPI00234F5875|nr:uncharacterized protein LOC123544933 [Mercenaria mercenaria]
MESTNYFRNFEYSVLDFKLGKYIVCNTGLIQWMSKKFFLFAFINSLLLSLGYYIIFSNVILKSSARQLQWIKSKNSILATKTIFTETPREQRTFVCNEVFKITLEENLKVIQNYPIGNAKMYLKRLGVNNLEPNQLRSFPVFVTAFDSTYFNESEGLFKSLHENFLDNSKYKKDVHIVAYDMGLTTLEALMVKRSCQCELRKFQFEYLPLHVRALTTYAFKPIIVQEVLMEFGFVWWVDTSIRFTTNNIDLQIAYTKAKGILYTVSRNSLMKGSLTKNTLNATFNYFQEDHCKFRPFHAVWATTLLFHFDRVTRAVVKAWVICALNKPCIAPTGSEYKRGCSLKENYDGRCHRFDQSAFGIIIRRLFHDQDYPVDKNLTLIYTIKRNDYVQYFK